MNRSDSLYGDATGRWALLTLPDGMTPPPNIIVGTPPVAVAALRLLGDPASVATLIYNRHASGQRGGSGALAVQLALAEMFGVTQQSVSRYIAGTSRPADEQGWRTLVLAWFHPAGVVAKVAEVRARRAQDRVARAGPPSSRGEDE